MLESAINTNQEPFQALPEDGRWRWGWESGDGDVVAEERLPRSNRR